MDKEVIDIIERLRNNTQEIDFELRTQVDSDWEKLRAYLTDPGYRMVPGFVSVAEQVPPDSTPVLGFRSEWVDDDFNPSGLRECFVCGDGSAWHNAEWLDYQDCYQTSEEAPTHWMPYPCTKAMLTASQGEGE